jgi:hypothetical protein
MNQVIRRNVKQMAKKKNAVLVAPIGGRRGLLQSASAPSSSAVAWDAPNSSSIAWPIDIDFQNSLNTAGARGHDHHLIAEIDHLVDIMGDEKRSCTLALPDAQHLLLHLYPRQGIECAERLIPNQEFRRLTSARAMATRRAMPPDS